MNTLRPENDGKLRGFLDGKKSRTVAESLTTQKERLTALVPTILRIAQELGFDPPETTFDIVPVKFIYESAAFGMPGVFTHWTNGEDYWKMMDEYENGSKIYELVTNTRPARAYFAENNPDSQQLLVMAHVLGHTDFFKHNIAFRHTDPHIAQNVLVQAKRITGYEHEYGVPIVEEFIDAAKAIMWNIDPDPKSPINTMSPREYIVWGRKKFLDSWETQHARRRTGYEDLLELDERGKEKPKKPDVPFPAHEERDVMKFVRMFAPDGFADWQADIFDCVRNMMVHVWGQAETKIMNEGWATYAHVQIMHKMDEDGQIPEESDDALEFASMHSGVIQPHPYNPNPYQLGLAIWQDIARKYRGEVRADGKLDYDWKGDKIDVRTLTSEEGERYNPRVIMETYRDASFLRDFLTPALVEELNLYEYGLQKDSRNRENWTITTRNPQEIINGLVASKINNGLPVIVVAPGGGDYNGKKELYLVHKYEDAEDSLRADYAEGTLLQLYSLWKRPVHLKTVDKGKVVIMTCADGKTIERKPILTSY